MRVSLSHTLTPWNLPSFCFHLHLFSSVSFFFLNFLTRCSLCEKIVRCSSDTRSNAHTQAVSCVLCLLAAAGGCFSPAGEMILTQLQFIHCIYLLTISTSKSVEKKKKEITALGLNAAVCFYALMWTFLLLAKRLSAFYARSAFLLLLIACRWASAVINLYFTPTLFLLAFFGKRFHKGALASTFFFFFSECVPILDVTKPSSFTSFKGPIYFFFLKGCVLCPLRLRLLSSAAALSKGAIRLSPPPLLLVQPRPEL